MPLLKLVPVLSFLAWIGLCGFLARRWGHANWEATLWIAFFCAGTRWAIFAGTNLMSDLLFGALVLASLHFLLSVEESKRPVRAALAAGLLCALAYTVRTSALALVASGILALVLRQRRRPALAFAAVSLCVVAAWMLWQGGGPVYSNPISAYYTAQNYADWNLLTGPYQRAEKLAVLVTNLSYLLTYPAQIVISSSAILPWSAAVFVGLLAWALYIRGVRLSPHLRAAHLCIGIYIALVLLWAWPPDRFLTSLLPVIALTIHLGLPRRMRTLYLAALPAGALLFSAWANLEYERANGIPWMTDDRHLNWTQLSTLHDWIQKNAEPGAVVMANFDPAVFLYTGHRAIRPYVLDNTALFYGFQGDPGKREAAFREQLIRSQVRYLVRSSTDQEELDLSRWVMRLRSEGAATAVEVLPDEYQIYRIDPDQVRTNILRSQK